MTLKKCQLTCAVGNLGGFSLSANFFGGVQISIHVRVHVCGHAHE